MSARHPQVRQSEQCHQLRRVFGQAAKAHLGVTELALDYPERMLDLGAHLSLGLFNLALGFVQHAALIEFFVGAAACRHLPDNFTSFMLGRSEEHTSELQSLMRISYAVFCLKKKKK